MRLIVACLGNNKVCGECVCTELADAISKSCSRHLVDLFVVRHVIDHEIFFLGSGQREHDIDHVSRLKLIAVCAEYDVIGNKESTAFAQHLVQFCQGLGAQRRNCDGDIFRVHIFRQCLIRNSNSHASGSICEINHDVVGSIYDFGFFGNFRFFRHFGLFAGFNNNDHRLLGIFGNFGFFRHFGSLGDFRSFRHFGSLGDFRSFRYFGSLGHFRFLSDFGSLGDFRSFRYFGSLGHFRFLGDFGFFGHFGSSSRSCFFLIYMCAQLELAGRALFQCLHSQQPGAFRKFHDLCKVFIADFSLDILQFDRLCCSVLFRKHGDVQIHAAGREAHLAILIQIQTYGQSLSALGDFTCKRTFFFNGAVHRNRGHQNSRLFGRFFNRHRCGVSHRCFSGISFGSCGRLFCRSFSGISFRSCGRLFCRSLSGISFRCCRGLFCRSFSGISFRSCGRLCSRSSCGLFCRSSRRLCSRSCGRLCSRGSRRFCRRSSRGLFCRGSRRFCRRGSRGGLCGSLRRFCRRSSRRYGLLDYFGQIGRAFSEDGCRQAVE